MSNKGIAYTNLLTNATEEQLLSLCEPELRGILKITIANKELLNGEQRQKVLINAADLSFACRDIEGKNTLLKLIKEKTQSSFVSDLASFAGLDVDEEKVVLDRYRSSPSTLEKYLAWRQDVVGKEGEMQEEISGIVSPKRGLRYYQLNGVRKILSSLKEKSRCLYQAPTGAGKTRTAMAVVARHLLEHGPTKVLWLASTTELVDQACIAFRQEWLYKGDTDAVLYSWRGGGASFNPSHATNKNTMLVASVQLLTLRNEEIDVLKGKVTLIVFDEAHQSLAPTYQDILAKLLGNKNCKLLGLSATPIRTESEKASNQLAKMYGDSKIPIYSGNRNPIEFLVEKGFLAKTHFQKIDFSLKNIPKPKPNSNDYSQNLLDWLGGNVERNLAIIKYVKEVIDQGRKRVLVFTPTILSARYCSLLLQSLHGINFSYCISGDTDKLTRNRNLAKFSSEGDEPIIIFNCQVLTTGFDAPKTDAIMIARPTKSPTLYAQMIGRALRGPKSSGTVDAYIYNFADQELDGYNNLISLFENFNRVWG